MSPSSQRPQDIGKFLRSNLAMEVSCVLWDGFYLICWWGTLVANILNFLLWGTNANCIVSYKSWIPNYIPKRFTTLIEFQLLECNCDVQRPFFSTCLYKGVQKDRSPKEYASAEASVCIHLISTIVQQHLRHCLMATKSSKDQCSVTIAICSCYICTMV